MNRRSLAVMVGIVLLATACADAPTASGGDTSTTAPTTDVNPLDAIEAQLEGLDAASRRARLVELAQAEDGVTTLYASMSLADSEGVVAQFRDAYGLDVEIFRANSGTVLQRILQEAEADFSGADVVLSGALEMALLSDEELLLPLDTPASADILEGGVFPRWAGVYVQTFVAAWNTNNLPPADVPATWEEVLTEYPEAFAMELEDWDWFATLVEDYFVAQLGYTEAEAIDLFRAAAADATIVDGHTLMSELTAAGEFDLIASGYQARVSRIRAEGAPIEWEPAVEPLIFRPNGAGVHSNTDTPATALLLVEFLLTDAQPTIGGFGRTPANMTVAGGLGSTYELLALNVDRLNRDRAKWEPLYASIVELAGTPVVEE